MLHTCTALEEGQKVIWLLQRSMPGMLNPESCMWHALCIHVYENAAVQSTDRAIIELCMLQNGPMTWQHAYVMLLATCSGQCGDEQEQVNVHGHAS